MADEKPAFDVRYDPADRILILTLHGFWRPETMSAYVKRLLPEVERLRAQRTRYAILSDARTFGVQSREISAAFDQMAQRRPEFESQRTAVVVAGQLNKMQVQRVFGGPDTQVFLDYDEARAWLMESRDTIA